MPPRDVEFGGQRRSFLMEVPPDWALHYGRLYLLIGLHAHGQSAEDFYDEAEIGALFAGALTIDPTGAPFVPKFVAIFPRAVGLQPDVTTGHWNTGLSVEARITDLDDVAFVGQCVIEADKQLRAAAAALGLDEADLAPSFYHEARILVIGKGDGGTLAYRFQSEIQGPRPNIVPHTIAVAGATAGGWLYTYLPTLYAPGYANASAPGVGGGVSWGPGAVTSNVLHFHSLMDTTVLPEGGVSPRTRRRVDALMGAGRGDGFYRSDFSPGPFDPADPTPAIGNSGLQFWVQALFPPWVPVAPVFTQDPVVSTWSWQLTSPAVGGTKEVRYLLTSLDRADENRGNLWPRSDELTQVSAASGATGLGATGISFVKLLE